MDHLQFIVPIFNFNYIGENKSSNDMWMKSDFHENLKSILIDSENDIGLTKFDSLYNCNTREIDYFSKQDFTNISLVTWAFQFSCSPAELEIFQVKLNLLLLAFRISKHSDLSIKYIICKDAPHLSIRYSDDWKYAFAEKHPKRKLDELNSIDLNIVISSYKKVVDFFNFTFRTRHAVDFLFLAYTAYNWKAAYILFMTSLETLISPPTEDQITSHIIKRTRKLINDSKICSKKTINALYELRSNIIHGRVLYDLNINNHLDDLVRLQKIVLKSFEIILEKDFKSIYKNEDSKEKFYNQITELNH